MKLFQDHPDFRRRLNKAEFAKRLEEISRRLKTEVRPFEDQSREAVRVRKERGRRDIFFFGRTYFPHYIFKDPAQFHREVNGLIDAPPPPEGSKPPIIVGAPRDHAKTTVFTFLKAIHRIAYALEHFIIIGSDTRDLAEDLCVYLFLDLAKNERLTADFGPLLDPKQAAGDFVAETDCRVLARGSKQRIRGLKHGPHRPGLILLDDMENDDNVQNPKLCKKRLDWVKDAVLPGVDSMGTVVWVGTILAKKSALGMACHSNKEPYKDWTRRVYRALTKGQPLWPARWPLKKLQAKKKQVGTITWNKEYQNNPQDEDSPFREEWFKYYEPQDLKDKRLVIASGTDPSAKQQGDDKAHSVVALDRETMILYVLSTWGRKLSPSGLMDGLYQSESAHHWVSGVVEENALGEYLADSITTAAKKHGRYLPLRPIHNTANKESRIVGTLSPRVENGEILFLADDPETEDLIEELLYLLDASTPDNRADALEMGVRHVQSLPGLGAKYESVEKRTDWSEGGRDDDDEDGGAGRFAHELAAGVGVW